MKDEEWNRSSETRRLAFLAFLLAGNLFGGCSIYDIKDRVETVWRDTFSHAVEEPTSGAVPGSVPESHVNPQMDGTASIQFTGAAPLVWPWGSSTPEPVCSSSALVETADVFSDGFESGDTSRWTWRRP